MIIEHHPAELLDTYLEICSGEQLFVSQALAAFDAVDSLGSMLDCAVGTGFGTIPLLRSGLPLVCSDGSAEMIERFHLNCRRAGLGNRSILAQWADLPNYFPAVFDLVMCRGNSLAYADSWDDEEAPNPDPERIGRHLRGMAGALRSGGALLLDIPDTRDITSDVSYVTENGGLTRDGLRVAIVDEVHVSLAHRLRRWRTTMTIDGTVYGFERTSHLIQLEEVRSDLKACGFDEVKTLEIRNIRDNFISLLAIKL